MTDRAERDFDTLVGSTATAATPDAPATSETPASHAAGRPLTRLDAWWGRVLRTPTRRRVWAWAGPLAVTVLAALLRLWHLNHPATLVFDETYYVKDAWSLHNLGYEGSWPTDYDATFAKGGVDGFLTNPSFVAHPPLGKWLIGLGMAVFGPENPASWRVATVVVGVLAVLLVALIGTYLFKSTMLGTLAGFLMAIDGHAIVMSRVALLDNFVMFFGLLAFAAVMLDRRQSARRLDRWIAHRRERGRDLAWGPALWARPWLVTAGLMCGLATGVKWNGLYFLAFFALYTVVVDGLARRRAGVEFWATGTLLKQAPVSFLLTVPIAALAYLATWTGWFVTSGGYDRHWIEQGGTRWTGALAWVPDAFQNFWHYQSGVYAFNVGLHTPHAYQANPFTWLLMLRPTSMYYQGSDLGQNGCDVTRCGEAITSIANPLIWYLAVLACGYLLYRLVRYREWRYGLILLGVGAGYLPWLAYADRTIFQFYTISFEPYLLLALAATFGVILGRRTDDPDRRLSGIGVVTILLVVSIAVSVFFYPLWTAQLENWDFIRIHYWIPSWK
ncbi:dolichyl-phosphate-mannose--protein mannosyltransferase [Frigoribacterium sp. 2-23]|uniref:dolichyl-phosphate-mannose--protein mannosyltransferase n=1 Tax=Frigoribacterium sp. 2-23 TaxID=3415006 RepID=UPI003C6FE9FF